MRKEGELLSGELVRLRALEMDDLERCHAWINDAEVTRYLGSQAMFPVSRGSEQDWLAAATRRAGFDDLTLAIETLTEARHIGTVALHEVRPSNRKAMLGIMIGEKDCWSRGYGTDAILTLLRFAFDEMNLNRVALEVHAANARAIACYHKCGFREEGRLREDRYQRGAYHDTLIMGVLSREFRVREGGSG